MYYRNNITEINFKTNFSKHRIKIKIGTNIFLEKINFSLPIFPLSHYDKHNMSQRKSIAHYTLNENVLHFFLSKLQSNVLLKSHTLHSLKYYCVTCVLTSVISSLSKIRLITFPYSTTVRVAKFEITSTEAHFKTLLQYHFFSIYIKLFTIWHVNCSLKINFAFNLFSLDFFFKVSFNFEENLIQFKKHVKSSFALNL